MAILDNYFKKTVRGFITLISYINNYVLHIKCSRNIDYLIQLDLVCRYKYYGIKNNVVLVWFMLMLLLLLLCLHLL